MFIATGIYNLYAVSNHIGTTLGGHYTAYCRNPVLGEWYSYNDSRFVPPALLLHYGILGQSRAGHFNSFQVAILIVFVKVAILIVFVKIWIQQCQSTADLSGL